MAPGNCLDLSFLYKVIDGSTSKTSVNLQAITYHEYHGSIKYDGQVSITYSQSVSKY
jgi:hypothetical protein